MQVKEAAGGFLPVKACKGSVKGCIRRENIAQQKKSRRQNPRPELHTKLTSEHRVAKNSGGKLPE
jgi:hypothetical protein